MRVSRTARWVAALAAAGALVSCTSSGASGDRGSTPEPAPTTSSTSAPTRTSPAPPAAPGDWPTYHGDVARTGFAASMPTVSGPMRIVKRLALDGAVYASPLVVRGVTIVATENNTVYALNAAMQLLWKRHLGPPSPAAERPCGNIDPLGITGTPYFNATNDAIFVAPEYSGDPPTHELVSLDFTSGAVKWHRGLDLPGADQRVMQERGALTVSGPRVFVPFGGMAGDCGDYKGRVIGLDRRTGDSPISYTVPTTREAGIWTPPGPVVGSDGNLLVAVGNGASGPGDRYDYSDSVLELSPTTLQRTDSFSPTTWATDNAADLDLGSQGPAIVGRWVFSAGKSGDAYVLRRDHLGGIGGQVSKTALCTSFGGTSVVADVVYVPCTDGIRAVRIDGAGTMHVLWHADGAVTGAPVVGGGRVWSLDTDAGVLHALDPATGKSRAQITVGGVTRFATPALSGARVYLPTQSGLTVVGVS
ncbi:MAG TPA: PQQ-binding-like beta-propeller repeat protein [Jatrophihabitans sp.]|jgi:outer membrane protein assembly factor BamB|uniref:outer membrane protein assembly factor BamB family protein n=1 Tax=Jatrophihabitans sp. TaxID=1932789 RepID=UPI002E086725|nr:PQQ-binding-like beta-propeller repeat protein [Jatrophihabitans sp.]